MKRFQSELAKYIPALWNYGMLLSKDEGKARKLVSDTVRQALHLQKIRPEGAPLYLWLSRLMERQYMKTRAAYLPAQTVSIH